MGATTPAGRGRLPLGKAVGQAWALYLAGFVALAGGIALVLNPGAELRLVRWLLGLFLIGWGGLRLVHALTGPRRDRTWLLLSGLAILGAGIVDLVWPDVTLTALVYIVVVGGLCLASVDLESTIVRSATPANVDTVMVDGRILKRHRELVAFDVGRVVREAEQSSRQVRARAGGRLAPDD